MKNVVDSVIEQEKCMKCGGCVAICPSHVLGLEYNGKTGFFDVVQECEECTECGLCTRVCPALKEEYRSALGSYRSIYLTFSSEKKTRAGGTSGGSVNECCQFLLETKKVDAVLMVKQDQTEKVWTKPVWIEAAEPIKKEPREFASRYVSVPTCSLLQERKPNRRYAVIGTPCQISSAKKILGEEHFYIGIACSEGISFHATERYLKNRKHGKVKSIYYRGNGWPGKTTIQYRDGTFLEQEHYNSDFNAIYSSQIYRNKGCRFCHDQFAEDADISFFDFWDSGEVKEERIGKSGTIIRTEKGEELLYGLAEKQKISIGRRLTEKEVRDCQEWTVLLKKKYWKSPIIRGYYCFVDVLNYTGMAGRLSIWQYRFLGKIFRKLIYILKRMDRDNEQI